LTWSQDVDLNGDVDVDATFKVEVDDGRNVDGRVNLNDGRQGHAHLASTGHQRT
jgi:hypothetical protein